MSKSKQGVLPALNTAGGASLADWQIQDDKAFVQSLIGADLKDYWSLLKPRVMSLVVFSGLAGLLVAPNTIHPILAFTAVLCIAMASGGAGAINMWFDRDIDALMQRTKLRPIPMGRVAPESALCFGVGITVTAIALMGMAINWVAAGLLGFAACFYVFIYTIWLKRRTSQNIVIGGAAGAFPPMIGWAAVTGSVSLDSILLFALIFFWTPPHFWALALYRSGDYQKAGVPMLPVVSGKRTTKIHMLIYTLILFPLALAPYFTGLAGMVYAVGASLLGGVFILTAIRVWLDQQDKTAKQMFGYSIIYLFAIFTLLIIDSVNSPVYWLGN